MIYVIWKDHDGFSIEEFNNYDEDKAEEFISETLRMEKQGANGTTIERIIKGKEMSYERVEVVKTVKLRHTAP